MMEKGEPGKSLDDWDIAISLAPKESWLYFYRALALEALGRLADAELGYRQYLALDLPSTELLYKQDAEIALEEIKARKLP